MPKVAAYVGDVTALQLLTLQQKHSDTDLHCLLAGIGNELRVFDVVTGRVLLEAPALPTGARLHGMHSVTGATASEAILAIYGDSYVQVMRLSAVSSSQSIGSQSPTLTIQTLIALPRQHQWVLDALLLPLPRAAVSQGLSCRGMPYAQKQQPALCLTLAVGFTDNSVELHALEVPFELTGGPVSGNGRGDAQLLSTRPPLMRVECAEHSSLYSMALYWHVPVGGCHAQLWVAAGTAFLHILVWQLPALSIASLLRSAAGPSTTSASAMPGEQPVPSSGLRRRGGATSEGNDTAAADTAVAAAVVAAAVAERGRMVSAALRRGSDLIHAATGAVLEQQMAAEEAEAAAAVAPANASQPHVPQSAITRPALLQLDGHEGSIHRLRWAPDGSSLASGSDDRTVRLWDISLGDRSALSAGVSPTMERLVLRGHTSRLWDLQFAGRTLVTASEDCTARVWSLADGSELAALRGHTGRGVWRIAIADDCIATAGADASIKLWSLRQSCSGTSRGPSLQTRPPHEASAEGKGEVPRFVSENGGGGQETLCGQGCEGGQGGGGSSDSVVTLAHCPHPSRDDDAPRDASGQPRRDSKSEYVRCLALSGSGALYVATNRGLLQRVHLPGPNTTESWQTLHKSPTAAPILAIALRGTASNETIALGDNSGHSTLLTISSVDKATPTVTSTVIWQPHGDSAVLGVFQPESLQLNHVLTVDKASVIRWWHAPPGSTPPLLLAEAVSPFAARLVCMDVSPDGRLLLAGNQVGAVVAFAIPANITSQVMDASGSPAYRLQLQCISALSKAHASMPVSLTFFTSDGSPTTAGRDSTLRTYAYKNPSPPPQIPSIHGLTPSKSALREGISTAEGLEGAATVAVDEAYRGGKEEGGQNKKMSRPQLLRCISEEVVPGLTAVVADRVAVSAEGVSERLVAGFQADSFVVRSVTHASELLRLRCGSMRRPFSLQLVGADDITFAFHRDDRLHIYRRSPPGAGSSAQPSNGSGGARQRALHLLHHGREVRCVGLVPPPPSSAQSAVGVLTGSDDSTIRRMLFDSTRPLQRLSASSELGGHAAGTGVRALALVPLDGSHERWVLISAGVKEVLMAWRLSWSPSPTPGLQSSAASPVSHQSLALGSEWLSTRPPPRGGLRRKSNPQGMTSRDSDQRYLAATAWLAPGQGAQGDVVAVMAAASDASLQLLAFHVEDRSWSVAADLLHSAGPVLSVAHVRLSPGVSPVTAAECGTTSAPDLEATDSSCEAGFSVPAAGPNSGTSAAQQERPELLLGFSGATSGGVAVWDLTAVQPQLPLATEGRSSVSGAPPLGNHEISSQGTPLAVQPVAIIAGAHQSGVNALSVAVVGADEVVVVTGGDDQAIHVAWLRFVPAAEGVSAAKVDEGTASYNLGLDAAAEEAGYGQTLEGSPPRQVSENEGAQGVHSGFGGGYEAALVVAQSLAVLKLQGSHTEADMHLPGSTPVQATSGDGNICSGTSCTNSPALSVSLVSSNRTSNAHSSALRGIWTDGSRVFSVGLDQRLRIWLLELGMSGPGGVTPEVRLVEETCLFTQVIEPEAMSVVAVGRAPADVSNAGVCRYLISVVGRGTEVLEYEHSA